ncbi:MAG TPA: 2OG-Fe dioxygenase family protein [Steroidobacteraceae bacterium]|nr:2OG-Fe dioxygenase family protein [Steroidobacteraceae bacterium]
MNIPESPLASSRDPAGVVARLDTRGYAFIAASDLGGALGVSSEQLEPLREWWTDLPRDQYLRDGGRYRFRRHSCFVEEFAPDGRATLTLAPHRAHWQPTSYNALHGGLERWFEPISARVVQTQVWEQLLTSIGSLFARVRPVSRWYIEAHQFRIDTASGIGRPTPEGAHRDGVDFVALLLVRRHNVRGGESRVFDANGPTGVRFTMQEPWSALLMDDARVIHETTPIQPNGESGVRDTLVLTYRAQGFQAPD